MTRPEEVTETPIVDFDACLKCGECFNDCPNQAVRMTGEAIEIIDERCVNCWICVDACPAGLIANSEGDKPDNSLVDAEICIGCSICAQSCPFDAIEMDPEGQEQGQGLPVFDPAKCVVCDTCAEECPVDCINVPQQYRDGYADESILGEPKVAAP